MRALFLLALLTGCGHSAVVVSNAQPTATVPGLNVNAVNVLGAAIVIGVAATAATQDMSGPQPSPMSSGWSSQPVPAMAADREIQVQDCTKPLDLSGNLRCR